MNPRNPPQPHADLGRARGWHRQPVVWIGALLYVASLAGCILMIVLGVRYADTPLPIAGGEVMHMPLARAPAPDTPAKTPR